MELDAYPFLALLFVAIFSREVIAPASRNGDDSVHLRSNGLAP